MYMSLLQVLLLEHRLLILNIALIRSIRACVFFDSTKSIKLDRPPGYYLYFYKKISLEETLYYTQKRNKEIIKCLEEDQKDQESK
jgi:hypothetical protein